MQTERGSGFKVEKVVPCAALDHDDFGSVRSEIINVIDSFKLERDAGGKPVPTFPHPALASAFH